MARDTRSIGPAARAPRVAYSLITSTERIKSRIHCSFRRSLALTANALVCEFLLKREGPRDALGLTVSRNLTRWLVGAWRCFVNNRLTTGPRLRQYAVAVA